jgi:two-component system CheB/CheR fusion protein
VRWKGKKMFEEENKKQSSPEGTEGDESQSGNDSGNPSEEDTFPVIGLGASAGGLSALKEFFSHVPKDSGFAYVVVIHLSPDQPSVMADLINDVSSIPVATVEDGQRVEKNHGYVIPPDKELSIYQGTLQLMDKIDGAHFLPIDVFLRSLAHDQGKDAAAVILSGTGTDGTLGAREIKATEGLIMAQSEDSAEYTGMPRSAMDTGQVDMVLSPGEMPEKLIHYFDNVFPAGEKEAKEVEKEPEKKSWLNKVYAILRSRLGHDFSGYKKSTILRRINRRMGLNHIEGKEQYAQFLRENPEEADALFREFLIGVTSFFREPESFEALKKKALPELIQQMDNGETFRAWVPGCSTGEEVYSLIIVLKEFLENQPKRIELQLFGTDIDEKAISKAREGLYPASISADVNKERLKRFFTKEGEFYRIRKEIRECAVFSAQDILRDPPFSKLHLLCCRNVLIYLEGQTQRKILPLFHYTLRPGSILMLGSSENIGDAGHLFSAIDKKQKIFRRQDVAREDYRKLEFPSAKPVTYQPAEKKEEERGISHRANTDELVQKAMVKYFAPPAALVDSDGDILHILGRVGEYLEPPCGPPTHNILDQGREGLNIELTLALRKAKSKQKAVTRHGVRVKTNGQRQTIDLHVYPLEELEELEGRFLVVFEKVNEPVPEKEDSEKGEKSTDKESARIAELEKELRVNREKHQTTLEELESSNEELKSTNEELQSSNEELQSTNEEMESSKEELQSLNEELQTVNSELQNKVEELSSARDDMRNLLNSIEIATIFVDSNGNVRRFNEKANSIVNLIQSDIGRPLKHVVSNLCYDSMIEDLDKVLKNWTPQEREVETQDDGWFRMCIMPYRSTDNRIDGAVLTFSNINEQKKVQKDLRVLIKEKEAARQLVYNVFDMNIEPLLVLDKDRQVIIANDAFSELTGLTQDEILGKKIFEISEGIFQQKELLEKLKSASEEDNNFRIQGFQSGDSAQKATYELEGRIIQTNEGEPYRILLRFIKKD